MASLQLPGWEEDCWDESLLDVMVYPAHKPPNVGCGDRPGGCGLKEFRQMCSRNKPSAFRASGMSDHMSHVISKLCRRL
jgi:hypothetical protein